MVVLCAAGAGVASAAQIRLSWRDNSNNEDGFRIERSLLNLIWEERAVVGPNVTTYVDRQVLPGVLYTYRVSAFNRAGRSSFSNPASARVKDAPAAANQPPKISAIGNRTVTAGKSSGPISFSVSDPESKAADLVVTVKSSNTSAVPTNAISLQGGGANRQLHIRPPQGRQGSSNITVTVTDGDLSSQQTFRVRVVPPSPPPPASSGGGKNNSNDDSNSGKGSGGGAGKGGNSTGGNPKGGGNAGDSDSGSGSGSGSSGSGEGPQKPKPPPSDDSGSGGGGNPGKGSTPPKNEPPPSSGGGKTPPAPAQPLEVSLRPRWATPAAGTELVLQAEVSGASSPEYQWLRNGEPIAGARSARLVIPAIQEYQEGYYRVRVTDGGRSRVSARVGVDVQGVQSSSASRLLNLSTRARCGAGDAVLIAGFSVQGEGGRPLLLRAVGPTLATKPFNVAGVLPDPGMVLRRWNGRAYQTVAENHDWDRVPEAAAMRTAAAGVWAFDLPDGSRDAALLRKLGPGQYTAVVSDARRRDGVALVEMYDLAEQDGGPVLTNLSSRGYVGTGDDVMILGFVVSGGPMNLLVRAVGPGLEGEPFNVSGVLRNPAIEVHGGASSERQRVLHTNDDWEQGPSADLAAAVAKQVSAFALKPGSRDAALVATFQPGVYTVVVRGSPEAKPAAQRGVALVELYRAP